MMLYTQLVQLLKKELLLVVVCFSKSKAALKQTLKAENADEATEFKSLTKAVEAPLRTIVENAGGEGSVVIAKITEGARFRI